MIVETELVRISHCLSCRPDWPLSSSRTSDHIIPRRVGHDHPLVFNGLVFNRRRNLAPLCRIHHTLIDEMKFDVYKKAGLPGLVQFLDCDYPRGQTAADEMFINHRLQDLFSGLLSNLNMLVWADIEASNPVLSNIYFKTKLYLDARSARLAGQMDEFSAQANSEGVMRRVTLPAKRPPLIAHNPSFKSGSPPYGPDFQTQFARCLIATTFMRS